MEIIKNEKDYKVTFANEKEAVTITEEYGYYYCNGYEFETWEKVISYCERLDKASIALSACCGWFFNECGELEKNVSIFDLLSVTYVYLDSRKAVELFAEYTMLAYDAGLLQYAYEPNSYTSESFLVLDSRKGLEEYEEHNEEDVLLSIFKALINKGK